MAYGVVQSIAGQDSFSTAGSKTVTLGSAPTAANAFLWIVTFGDFGTNLDRTVVLTDGGGINDAKFVQRGTIFIDTLTGFKWGTAENISAGTGANAITATFKVTGVTTPVNYPGLAIVEFSSLATSGLFTSGETAQTVDPSGKQFAPGTGADAITTSNLPVLAAQPVAQLTFAVNLDNAVAPSASGSATNILTLFDQGGGTAFARLQHKRLTATTAVPGTMTAVNGADTYYSFTIALKEAASAAIPFVQPWQQQGGMGIMVSM